MAPIDDHPTRIRRWAVLLPLAAAAIVALYTVLNNAVYAAYLIAGRHLFVGPGIDGRLTVASLPQVSYGQGPSTDTVYLVDVPLWLRWLCAAPLLLFAIVLLLATILIVVAVRRFTTGTSGRSVAKPWKILAAVLILGGLAQGLVDTAAIHALHEHYEPSVVFNSALATAAFTIPWSILAFGLLAAAIAAATAHGTQHTTESS